MLNGQAVVFLNDSPHVKTLRGNREEKSGGIKVSLPLLLDVTRHVFIHEVAMEGVGGGRKNKQKKQKTWTVNTSPAAATPSKIQPQAIKQNCVDDGRRQSGTSGQSEEGQSAPSANGRAAKLLDKFGALKREGEGGEGTPSMYCRILEQFREIIVINNYLSSTQFTG